ncbi:MAG: histidine phosphatase family protein [Nigerium sp.]|nr:histidine phosphatase family protein [Nigerium sp.]
MRGRVVILARHAKSSWATNDPDLARPLSGRGKRDGLAAGRRLADFHIDVALVSPRRGPGRRGSAIRTVARGRPRCASPTRCTTPAPTTSSTCCAVCPPAPAPSSSWGTNR